MTQLAHVQVSETLLQLLLGSGYLDRSELIHYKNLSTSLNKQLIETIMSAGILDRKDLDIGLEALERVKRREISPDLAIRSLRIARKKRIPLRSAIGYAKNKHKTTRIKIATANELTTLLLDSSIINRQVLGPFLVKSYESAIMIGNLMLIANLINIDQLLMVLNAIILVRSKSIDRPTAVEALKYANYEKITIEQALFELGQFVHPDAKELRIEEFLLMAGMITRKEFAECLEIHLFKNKDFGHILEERGIVTAEQLDTADKLLSAIKKGVLQPYEAAEVLGFKLVEKESINSLIRKIKMNKSEKPDLRMGDFLFEASLLTHSQIESSVEISGESEMKIGHALMKAKLIDGVTLYSALRLQTSYRLGYISRTKAIELLKYCSKMQVQLDAAFNDKKIFLPSRMQYSWV